MIDGCWIGNWRSPAQVVTEELTVYLEAQDAITNWSSECTEECPWNPSFCPLSVRLVGRLWGRVKRRDAGSSNKLRRRLTVAGLQNHRTKKGSSSGIKADEPCLATAESPPVSRV